MKHPEPFLSIFNDVIGPVMRGPSSSHTAGAYRIARLARSLYGGLPADIRCSFDPNGSYAPTYLPLGVDKAFCAGMIGLDMLDESYESAVHQAKAKTTIRFAVEPLEYSEHPNTVRLELSGDRNLTIWAKSTGGGVVEVFNIDGLTVSISGKHREALVLVPEGPGLADGILGRIRRDDSVTVAKRESESNSIQILLSPGDGRTVAELEAAYGAELFLAEPVFFPRVGSALVQSAEEFAARAETRGVSLGRAALEYECSILGLSEKEALSEMEHRYSVMLDSIKTGYNDSSLELSWLTPHAGTIREADVHGRLPYGGHHSRAAFRAHAVMHTCNSRGVVCAAPTGGSAGVLPAVMATLEEDFNRPRPVILAALFAAGAIGLVVAKRATFAAEVAGCQVEIGVAGAMGAAAAVEAAGGSARLALDAAAVALQNTMGSICDPVGGGCEIPCHTRNGAAASSAFTCADMVCGGYQNPVPLDETIDASYDVGKRLHSDFRCTARGGIALAPSALELVQKSKKSGLT